MRENPVIASVANRAQTRRPGVGAVRGLSLLIALLAFAVAEGAAATLHVDKASGNDSNTGLSRTAAFKTITRACNAVAAGDTVIVYPGVYQEHVQLTRSGTATQPIRFITDQIAKDRVIVSGAIPAIRNRQTTWTLEDSTLKLYSTPVAQRPIRVLYDDIDLVEYRALYDLRTFRFSNLYDNLPADGPHHGFYHDAASGKLYVRLHASGRYGSTDPRQHIMKVAPPRAGGKFGITISKPTDYNWGVIGNSPAHVTIDGFTFETPGCAGVWIQRGAVTVRNCWFRGCRVAVSGWTERDTSRVSADVVVERCDFSQEPTRADTEEVVARAEGLPAAQQAKLTKFFWWSRKYPSETSYQTGAFSSIGLRWKIRNNYIHDALDGVGTFGVSFSDQCEVSHNFFDRIVDNPIESGNHSRNLRVHHNYIRDAFEPFTYQPLDGPPFPSSVWIHHNVVYSSPANSAFWRKAVLKWVPGAFKIKPMEGFSSVGGDGFVAFNNTIIHPGNAFSVGSVGAPGSNFRFYNNLLVGKGLHDFRGTALQNMTFSRNIVAPAQAGDTGPGSTFAGSGGKLLASLDQMRLVSPVGENFALATGSPAIGAGAVLAQYATSSADVGALARGETWRRPAVGPLASSVPSTPPPPTTPTPPTTPPTTPAPPSTPAPPPPQPPPTTPGTPPPNGAGTLVVDDAFTDGRFTQGSDPLDIAWWRGSPSAGGTPMTLSIVNDTGLGGGPALRVENSGTNTNLWSSKAIIAPFPARSLLSTGDRIVLTFAFRFDRIFAGDAENHFSFGLYNSRGTAVTGDHKYPINNDDYGYTATVVYGGTPGNAFFTKEPGTAGSILVDADFVQLGTAIATSVSVGTSTTRRLATFAVEKTSAGIRLDMKITDAAGTAIISGSKTDTASPLTAFDEIIIGTRRMEIDYLIDSVRVEKISAP